MGPMTNRMGTRYEFLGQYAQEVEPDEGHSNYFRPPQDEHDPRLFEEGSNVVREEIRLELLNALYAFLEVRYAAPREWIYAWIAGSALTEQWSVDEQGKGDLDILLGIDMVKFYQHNPSMRSFSEKTIAGHVNTELREELWPVYADYRGQFEVTFYVNPSTGSDIRAINPYAAYNLLTASWDVEPQELPAGWSWERTPVEWRNAVTAEVEMAQGLIERYNQLAREVQAAPQGPRRVTLLNGLGQVVEQISALYEDIHANRRNAFQGRHGVQGHGFLDYYNFRWQMHKKFGTGKTLNQIRRIGKQVAEHHEVARYGGPVAQNVLTPATLKDHL